MSPLARQVPNSFTNNNAIQLKENKLAFIPVLIWAFYSCYINIHLSIVFLMPFTAIIWTAPDSLHPNEGFVWEQLEQLHTAPKPWLPYHCGLCRELCVLLHRISEGDVASVQKVYRGFARPKGSEKASQIKAAQNHEPDSFPCFIQQHWNKKKMVKCLEDLCFNTSQMILKSPSQLCQHLGRSFSLTLWIKDWVRNVSKV